MCLVSGIHLRLAEKEIGRPTYLSPRTSMSQAANNSSSTPHHLYLLLTVPAAYAHILVSEHI
jgi:hypothetical protein